MDIPILFSTPMVQAILKGKKTQTRRAIKFSIRDSSGNFLNSKYEIIKPPCNPGDILWVRETWCKTECASCTANDNPYSEDECDIERGGLTEPCDNGLYVYKATDNPPKGYKWHPSIHMPREAARLFLTVNNIRVERLQDISEEDAKAEGVTDPYDYQSPSYYEQLHMRGLKIRKSAFAGLWDSCYQWPKSWLANPWVWVVEFEVKEVRK